MDVVSQDHYLDHRLPAPARRAGVLRRPHPRGGRRAAVDADGVGDLGGELAAGERRQAARRAAARLAAPRGARGRTPSGSSSGGRRGRAAEKYHSALVPHAGPGLGAVPRGGGAGRRRWRRSARWPAAGCRPTSRCSGTGMPGGPATCASHPSERAALPRRRRSAGTARSPSSARPSTSCTRRPTCPATGWSSCPTLYLCSDADAAGLAAFVRAGGHALVTYFSGHRRRARPRPARRLPGRVPRAARGAGRRSSRRCCRARR